MGINYDNDRQVLDALDVSSSTVVTRSINIVTKQKDCSLRKTRVRIMIEEPTPPSSPSHVDADEQSFVETTLTFNSMDSKEDTKREDPAKRQEYPPGTKPGGRWYKETYGGSNTSAASTGAWCCIGPITGIVVSNMKLDTPYVYFVDGRFFDTSGRPVVSMSGTLNPVPRELSAFIMPSSESCLRSNQLAGSPSEQQSHAYPPSTVYAPQNIICDASYTEPRACCPPGTAPGGLWYQHTSKNGTRRLVYQPDPSDITRFYTKSGILIDPGSGTFEPPLSCTSKTCRR